MIWFVAGVALFNVICYILVWINWRRDAREIGKENLAVPLGERFESLFLMLTLPCILGFALGMKGR